MPESGSHSVAIALLAYLRRARDHIDRNYSDPLDLDGLARLVLVEPREFSPEDFK